MSKTSMVFWVLVCVLPCCGPSRAEQFESYLRLEAEAQMREEEQRFIASLKRVPEPDPRPIASAPLLETSHRSETVRIVVTAAVAPFAWWVLGDEVEPRLEAFDPGLDLQLRRESDRGAIERVLIGEADVAIVSVPLSTHELDRGLIEHEVTTHAWVLAAHQGLGLNTLTRHQLRSLLNGELNTLTALGGASGDLRLLVPGTRTPHDHAAMQLIPGDRFVATAVRASSNDSVVADLQRYRTALAVLPLSVARDAGLHMLSIDGVPASLGTRIHPHYPFQSQVRVISRRSPAAGIDSVVEALRALQQKGAASADPAPVRK